MIRISDLKQFLYCPRIIYWNYCCPVKPPPTYKMNWGKSQHLDQEGLELRRNLCKYGLDEGEKLFGIEVSGAGLTGKLDLLGMMYTQFVKNPVI